MNRQALADEINELIATEARSLTRHLEEATPHLTPTTYPIWSRIRHMSEASREHARRLTQLMADLDVREKAPTFETQVANYHYCTLTFLLPLLIKEKRKQIAGYERALSHAGDQGKANRVLDQLLAENREHLALLETSLATAAA